MRISDWISDVCSSDLFERLNLPELVRGRVRGGISSTRQFMPVIARTRSRIVSRSAMRSASSLVRHWTSTAGVSSPPGAVIAKAAMSPDLKIGRAHVELQSLMRISYAVFCLKKKKEQRDQHRQRSSTRNITS